MEMTTTANVVETGVTSSEFEKPTKPYSPEQECPGSSGSEFGAFNHEEDFKEDESFKEDEGSFKEDEESFKKALIERIERLQLNEEFSALLSRRMEYLARLLKLPSGWVSGGGHPPTRKAVDLSKELLSSLGKQIEGKLPRKVPKLVMGPLPSGGICVEVHSDEENAFYVSIYNDLSVCLDVKREDFYSSWEVDSPRMLLSKACEAYEAITE